LTAGGGDIRGGAVTGTDDAGFAGALGDDVMGAVVVAEAGAGLEVDVQATIRRPMTMMVAVREIEERIPGSLEGC
jgi:hypothetical protein